MTTGTTGSPLDPQEFKATQREIWSSVAPGWKKWWPVFEAGAQPLNERLVDLARVARGARVLDVATGIGEPALTAARRVGPKGSVLGVDLAPGMLEQARERARDAKLANAEFREMDAERLELEPASFDAATSRWGIMLMMDPDAVLRGIRRALKPGARVALAVWGPPENVRFISIPTQVAQRELGVPPPPPGTPGPMSMGKPGVLEALLERNGWRDLEVAETTATMDFASTAQYREFLTDQSSSLRKAMADHPAEARERAWSAIEREVRSHAREDGSLHFENQVRCASAVHSG
jgi:ubiquinone/menaquinone biosynthesis C-methylase UbiE